MSFLRRMPYRKNEVTRRGTWQVVVGGSVVRAPGVATEVGVRAGVSNPGRAASELWKFRLPHF